MAAAMQVTTLPSGPGDRAGPTTGSEAGRAHRSASVLAAAAGTTSAKQPRDGHNDDLALSMAAQAIAAVAVVNPAAASVGFGLSSLAVCHADSIDAPRMTASAYALSAVAGTAAAAGIAPAVIAVASVLVGMVAMFPVTAST